MAKIRLQLVEAIEILREGYIKIFKKADNLELGPVCSSYEETLQNAIKYKPDVILIGLRIRGGDRIKLTQRLKELHPDIRVILFIPPLYDYHFDPIRLLQSDADGFISGGQDSEPLFEELMTVYKGHTVVPQMLGGILRDEFIIREKGKEVMVQSGLSRREQEVLSLVAKGLTNREISSNLFITQNTVKVHINNILKKMKVRNRQQAVLKIRAHYLLSKANGRK